MDTWSHLGLPRWLRVKVCLPMQKMQVWSLGQEDPLERQCHPTPVFLPWESPRQKSQVSYILWGHRIGHNWAIENARMHPTQSNISHYIYIYIYIYFISCSSIESNLSSYTHLLWGYPPTRKWTPKSWDHEDHITSMSTASRI